MNADTQAKIQATFGALVVDKRDALQAGFELMPRFVTEYLLATARERNTKLTLQDVRERIRRFWVDADRKNEFLSRLMRDGRAELIALLEVEARPDRNEHVGHIPQLDGHDLLVPNELIERCPELLWGGLWGTCTLDYDAAAAPRRNMRVTSFTPYQLTRPDMNLFRRGRAEFNFDEWLQLLLTSAGYRPDAFETTRQKLLALSRLVPLCQTNVNMLELGPRGTGKSYLLRSLSARSYLLAGARATPARLLYDLQKKRVGIVGTKKVVVFDEIASTQFPDRSLVAALKDYMESGHIARGGKSLVADCSLVFCGNLELDAEGTQPHRSYGHLLELLPPALADMAIGDRLHGFIPGWELPKISDHVLADGTGFLSDYFGEVLTELRRDLGPIEYLRRNVQFENATTRDRVAIERIASGLLKLLYPNNEIEEGGLRQVLQVATELRQRIHHQLSKMAPGEFKPKVITFPGCMPHSAPDLLSDRRLEDQDVEVNQRDLVGKITILLVSPAGGGDIGFVECAQVGGSGEFKISGLRGAVLEQSVRAAYDALLHLGSSIGVTPTAVRAGRLAIHLVNMAQPKDGPSAGLAFALAMISAVTGKPIRRGIAVTGELSVQGNVNPIGGIAEKISAALAHQRKVVIIPAANAAELIPIRETVSRLEIHPVRTLQEAVKIAFECVPEEVPRAEDAQLPEAIASQLRTMAAVLSAEEIHELSAGVDQYLARLESAAADGSPVDVALARRLARWCRDLLKACEATSPDRVEQAVGAVRYFVSARDAIGDLSAGGLLDDERVLSYVARNLGISLQG